MFSTEEFIDLSRKFVCVRIETYENEESETLVKKVLHGKLENTAFVILNPQGTKALTRSGRSPGMAMISGRSRTDVDGGQNKEILTQMNQIARQFQVRADASTAELQDFNSLRQALNVASADQRLLVFVDSTKKNESEVRQKLKSVFADEQIVGKFHLNFADEKTDRNWSRVIKGAKQSPSIMIVRSSQFGLDGQAVDQLPLTADVETIKKSLLSANDKFAKVEKRKNYEQHVQAGRRQRISFENEISRSGASDGKGGRQKGARSPRRGGE